MQQVHYALDAFRDEACELIRKGVINSKQPIYMLCPYFPAHEWELIECELERNKFLLIDQILDLLGCRECWYLGTGNVTKYCDPDSGLGTISATPMRSPGSDCCSQS